ncbi:MAG: hypothetical protein L0Y56_10260 [Nitrospira sp.]|nr:hypothetical protein [Nitrospira sp.]
MLIISKDGIILDTKDCFLVDTIPDLEDITAADYAVRDGIPLAGISVEKEDIWYTVRLKTIIFEDEEE